MDIVDFEKEVMFLFRDYYKGTEKEKSSDWFKIDIESLYKNKKMELTILQHKDTDEDFFIRASSSTFSGLFITALYTLRDYLSEKPYINVLCSSCNGRGEFEQSAGSHSYFEDCDNCGGSGKA